MRRIRERARGLGGCWHLVRRWHEDESGAALLEFALVLPLLIVLVFGCFEIGRALLVRQAMDGAVRAGSRSLARVPDPACRPGCSEGAARAAALTLDQILANTRLSPAVVTITPRADLTEGTVTMEASVAFDIALLDPAVFGRRWILSARHQERYVGE